MMRPLWNPPPRESVKSWRVLGEDFIQFSEERSKKSIIGVGHSIGGTLLLYAAINNPDLFSKIILLDPVLLPISYHFGWRIAKKLGLALKFNPLIGPTLKRRRIFNSKEEMFERYRQKKVFSKFPDDALNTYIKHATISTGEGQLKLIYSPELEAEIYLSGLMIDPEIWKGITKIKSPITILYETASISFPASSRKKFWKLQKSCKMIEFPNYSHLFPMEAQGKVYSIIRENIYN